MEFNYCAKAGLFMRCHNLSWSILTKFVFLLLICSQAGHAQETEIAIDETSVKAAIQETAVLFVCLNQTTLESMDIDAHECKRKASNFANACWHVVDKIVPNYSIIADESGKERFEAIANVYSYCIQAELLMSAIRSKKLGASELQD